MVLLYSGFIIFVLGMLALDLGVLNRGAKVIRTGRALAFSGVCAALAMGFAGLIYYLYENHVFGLGTEVGKFLPSGGREAAMMFITGFVIEQSLSMDNIFVIAMIFGYFGVPMQFQHRTLFWGIVGALVMRLGMILIAAELIKSFNWILYIFGALLLVTAYKMWRSDEQHVEPDSNPLVKLARRFYPIAPGFDGEKFFTKIPAAEPGGAAGSGAVGTMRVAATPLFLALIAIESTDVIFAIDSIPAIFAITKDPFIVFTSNVFAILNLRSLYFALADMLDRFRLLKHSLVLVLAYVGVKMLVSQALNLHPPIWISMVVIITALAGGVIASMLIPPKPKPPAAASPAAGEGAHSSRH